MKVPIELMENVETVDQLISFLKIHRKILKGKTVTSTKGFVNKFKFYVLGYVASQKTHICEKCGSIMILDEISNKGTVVKASSRGTEIRRNATMDFKWLYFKCQKCGWRLCTTDR